MIVIVFSLYRLPPLQLLVSHEWCSYRVTIGCYGYVYVVRALRSIGGIDWGRKEKDDSVAALEDRPCWRARCVPLFEWLSATCTTLLSGRDRQAGSGMAKSKRALRYMLDGIGTGYRRVLHKGRILGLLVITYTHRGRRDCLLGQLEECCDW